MKEYLIGSAAIILAGAALAQAPVATPAPAPEPHAVLVAPQADRVQTRDEVVTKVREHFAQLDTNKDGFLTKPEAEAGRSAMNDHFRERFGQRGEWSGRARDPAAAFDRLDTNKDGSISRDEFAKGHEMRTERRVELKGGQPAAPGAPADDHRRMGMRHMGVMMMGGWMFDMSDANKDGRVSLQEATDAAVRHFDLADANHDGRITPEERRTMHRQMIEKYRTPKSG